MIESIPMLWWFYAAAAGFTISEAVNWVQAWKFNQSWYDWVGTSMHTVGVGFLVFFVWLLQAYDDKITEFVSTQDQQILQILMNMAQAMAGKGMI